MLSVLIPTYNYDVSTLVETIYNQLKASTLSFEIRIYDDASALSLPHLESEERPEIIHLISSDNIGRTATRQKLAQDATFNWLLFLDADVLPKEPSFIQNYLKAIQDESLIIYGGVAYNDIRPHPSVMLRWVYGTSREMHTARKRQNFPYYIISQNLCIRKETFLRLNKVVSSFYGMDNLFSNQIKRERLQVSHIDNPVIHLGLEPSEKFLSKSLKSIDTTVEMEQKGLMDDDFRSLQKLYLKLKKLGLTGLARICIDPFVNRIKRNLLGKKPNMALFDLYRLHYYITLKQERNA